MPSSPNVTEVLPHTDTPWQKRAHDLGIVLPENCDETRAWEIIFAHEDDLANERYCDSIAGIPKDTRS